MSSHTGLVPVTWQVSRKTPWRLQLQHSLSWSRPLVCEPTGHEQLPVLSRRFQVERPIIALPQPIPLWMFTFPSVSLILGSELTPTAHSLFARHGTKLCACKISMNPFNNLEIEFSRSQQLSVSEPPCPPLKERAAEGPLSLGNSQTFPCLKNAFVGDNY